MDLPNSLIATEVGMRVADMGARVRGTLVMICWPGECGFIGIAYDIRERVFTCVIAAAGLRMNCRQAKSVSRAKWGRKDPLSYFCRYGHARKNMQMSARAVLYRVDLIRCELN
ncbi:hypothetical protein [Burkholderia sp. LMG 32019]|uniref:hypothetical protein n=1 Tax=Burkholderia sp. LMG 32019 TaxID=3158173 RepID=UPI003C2DD860